MHKNNNQMGPFTRMRSYGLLALYAALAIFSLLLVLAAFRIWPAVPTVFMTIKIIMLAVTATFSAVTSMRATARMWIVLRNHAPGAAYVDFAPFLAMAFTLLAASWLFGNF